MARFRLVLRSLFSITMAAGVALGSATVTAAEPAAPAEPVRVVVLREHGAGSASAAQGYLDQLMVVVSKANAWAAAEGRYQTDRKRAEAYIAASKPEFGLLSLGAFLAMHKAHGLQPVGKAVLQGGGGEQYYLISRTAKDPADCRGQTLATTFSEDAAFVDTVVSGGSWSLADFQVQPQKRPLQPLKAVIQNEATCALVDDAQLAELGHMSDAEGVRPIWFSAKLPALVIVTFPSAEKAEAKRFRSSLANICTGEGAAACKAVGVTALLPIESRELATLIGTYKPS